MNNKDTLIVNVRHPFHRPQKASVVLECKFVCPCCKEYKFPYSHLIQRDCVEKLQASYTWTCPECVSNVSFSVDPADFSVTIIATVTPPKGHEKMLVLLELDTGDVTLENPICIVVEHSNYIERGKGYSTDLVEITEWLRYYYNSHTCPTNYLGVVAVVEGMSSDPHGVFRFKEVIWRPKDFNRVKFSNEGGDWSELFPSMRGD